MTRADCCRRPGACPAHAAGQCDHTTRPTDIRVDDATAAFLTALYGDDWPQAVAQAAARQEPS